MATKTKAKKAPAKRSPRRKAKPGVVVASHRFPAGTIAGFYPAAAVEHERNTSREPCPNPTETAKVAKDGTLTARGLKAGSWQAAAEVDGRWRYFNFTVS